MIEALTVFAVATMAACAVAVACRVAWPVVKALAALMDDTWRVIRRMVLGRSAPAALPPKVWCTCGSRSEAVPVEVHDGPDGPEVVAWLCPECREERRPPGEPVMTSTGPECHNCAEPWSMALDAPRDCDRCECCGETAHKHGEDPAARSQAPGAGSSGTEYPNTWAGRRAALAEVNARMHALSGSWGYADGAFVLSRREHDEYRALVERAKMLREDLDALERQRPKSAPVYEVEHGGYIYSVAEGTEVADLCEGNDHEWQHVRVQQLREPVMSFCSACRLQRRPKPVVGPVFAPDPEIVTHRRR